MDQLGEGPQRSGSVKRARERAAAAERLRKEEYERQYGIQPSALNMQRQKQENMEQGRSRQQMPPANAMSTGQPGYGLRTAMITPQPQQVQEVGPQWPFPAPLQISASRVQQRQPPSQQAPARPLQHPQHLHPSMRQAPFVQEQSAQIINGLPHAGSQSREAESYLDESSYMTNLSTLATPGSGTDVSRESQASSTGTIPDFPAPNMPAAHKSTGLGLPPSARRGPDSFYSVNSFNAPISEESPKVPVFDPATSYLADKTPEERGRREQSPNFFEGVSDDDDIHIEQGIVRSASMGRKAKPTMVQNRNSDKVDHGGVLGKTRALMGAGMIGGSAGSSPSASRAELQEAIQNGQQRNPAPPIPTIVHPAHRESERPQWPTFGGDDSPIENKELDLSSSDSDSELTPTPNEVEMKRLQPVAFGAGARHLTPSPSVQSFNSGGLGPGKEKDGLTAIGEIQYNRNSAIRRPPKLNLNAVRDAEARGSLTSLPDLIRRATKLASMMNEGRRPTSRLHNLNEYPMENSEKGSFAPNTRLSGLSGMLAAFPPPGANGTPLATPRSGYQWPEYASSLKALRTPHKDANPKPRRRCCGMPLWCFLLTLLLLLCVIAAAIAIPLKLLVFNGKKASTIASAITPIQKCQSESACLNGGTSVLFGDTCACICANGYEGTRCDTLGTQGCTTVNYFGTETGEQFEKITVGNAIPRLVDLSDTKYSVPLFYENLINELGRGGVSCSGGNALVSFNGETGAEYTTSSASASSSKVATSSTKAASTTKASTTAAPSATESGKSVGGLGRREIAGVDTEIALATGIATAASGAAATSIIIAPAATATSSASTTNTGNITITTDTFDFARVAVLYVVQERSVKEGLQAQAGLLSVFKGLDVETGKNGTIKAASCVVAWTNGDGGAGYIDLSVWTVGVNGTEGAKVGGRGKAGVRIY